MPGTPRHPLSIGHYAAPPDMPVEAFLDAVAAHGLSGVGLTRAAIDAMPPDRLAGALAARGLGATSLNSAGYFLRRDADERRAQERVNHALVEAAATLGAPLNVIPGGPFAGGVTLEAARAAIVPRLEALAEAAGRAGVRLSLEPIGPHGVATKGCVNQIAAARALAARIPHVSLTLDLFHTFWDADLPDLLDRSADEVAVLQVCDVRLSEAAPPARAPLGEGHLDLPAHAARIAAAGYPRPVEFEIFHGEEGGRAFDRLLSDTAAAWAGLVGEAA